MRDKTKKTKTQIKFRDLKPAKDAKGGTPPGPCRRGRSGFYAGNHNEVFLQDAIWSAKRGFQAELDREKR